MALTAAIATAVATFCAAASLGMSSLPLAAGLVLIVAWVAARPDRTLPRWFTTRLLAWVTGIAALAVYVTGLADSAGGRLALSGAAILTAVVLGPLWTEPWVLRYCLLLTAGALAMGATASALAVGWPLAGFAAGAAVALVAANRLAAARVPPLVPGSEATAVRRRRLAAEAGVLLAVAGLIGLLVAALLPPPQNHRPQGGAGTSGEEAPSAPYLFPAGELAAGGRGSGKGDRVVFRVSAPGPALWRTDTFGAWNGQTWERAEVGARPGAIDQRGRYAFVPPGIGDVPLGGSPFVQRITVEAPIIGLLPAAVRASGVQLPGGRLTVDDAGTLVPLPPLGKGTTFVVTSFLAPSREAARLAAEAASPERPAGLAEAYLGFPALPAQVPALAGEITASVPTAFDKAAALETWFLTNTEEVPGAEPLPPGTDPIDHFLLHRRGSNEQAATTMAIMLRSLGIPTRLAVGYVAGQRAPLGGDFVVRVRHAHAWVEAWFPGAGWVTFDPAGRAPPSPPPRDSFLSRLRHLLGVLVWLLLVVAVAALAWAAWKVLRWYRERRARPWV
ncbi:MAG: DUF3488 and transglutaminase-like domain-containing protein, partial [Actinomycetota bacterium]|nr:DUF3488 and transglutaminase-like domain-containing protein [Actinomycetota bacterium]